MMTNWLLNLSEVKTVYDEEEDLWYKIAFFVFHLDFLFFPPISEMSMEKPRQYGLFLYFVAMATTRMSKLMENFYIIVSIAALIV